VEVFRVDGEDRASSGSEARGHEHLPAREGVAEASDPDTLFGLSFDSKNRAQQFMLAINELAHDQKLHLVDAVLVVKDDDDHVRVRETIDPQPGRSALSGAMWTGLLGLLFGGPVGWIAGLGVGAGIGAISAKVIDLGIPDEWVSWFKEAIESGTATVVVLAGEIDQSALRAEVERFPGVRLVHTTVHTEAFAQLRSALDDDRTSGAPNEVRPPVDEEPG
jgi:uncharacterized membrane protein